MAQESGVKAGRAICSFLFSPVGIITYFMIRDERPKNARAYLGISLTAIAISAVWFTKWQIDKAVRDKNKVDNYNPNSFNVNRPEPTPRPYTS